ncbi:MAG: hypothetical protein A6F71_10480 [Cycloclasticus sp. symbiont of Poecilosclerida sp. M]|nr:MAG: hypothetical protein A6F71_10480 [Cycloclasticus sp. symbiont of Poecilosclerida sp. M]
MLNYTHIVCDFTGMVQVYSTLSVALWWFMLTAALFWKIWFPINARLRETKHHIKYIHIVSVLIGALTPLIPVIALMSRFADNVNTDTTSNTTFLQGGLGFASVRFPPVPCNGNSKVIIFYTNILPADILLATGITFIVLIFWTVHKVSSRTHKIYY